MSPFNCLLQLKCHLLNVFSQFNLFLDQILFPTTFKIYFLIKKFGSNYFDAKISQLNYSLHLIKKNLTAKFCINLFVLLYEDFSVYFQYNCIQN